ncbi:hypothetical protein COV54_03240 [Candidatus Jorgensenbacteria bacterium CG11_big_fil_rev_8_21_14_0_20_38_23]|uniref:Polyprenol-phosphate-mannose--protein mannosyltransferase n=2 Tax=Candidatus Joergenseniibacteriota TaxID=1752739 RepID=A0A2H0NDH5_9BACT|nr:MAG: hypothetical protein COV54_03240 [Candidatus Jorgensenbacteria bacterium CG11_big_fil_rev_8_21_14_0_20_38_23]
MAMVLKYRYFFLFIIVLISLGFHLFNLSEPDKPVADELFFSTFSADYRLARQHLDIHPPLGKLLFSLPLFFVSQDKIQNFQPLTEFKNPQGHLDIHINDQPFGSFPYLNLRLLSAFFGVLLVLLMYFFLKILSGKESVALLGAFFMAWENSLLLQSRLILLDGFYLVFGLLALILFFKNKSRPLLAGLIWGLALSVKLTAAVFLGPIILAVLLTEREEEKKILRQGASVFFTVGVITILAIELLGNNLFISPEKQLAFYETLGSPSFFWIKSFASHLGPFKNIFLAITVSSFQILNSFSGYTSGGGSNLQQSAWYGWPLMLKPMVYFSEKIGDSTIKITSFGNPIIWVMVTTAVISSFFLAKKYLSAKSRYKDFWILFGGYWLSLLPLAFVFRPTFLYHYLPALIFGIGLASWLIIEHFQNESVRERKWKMILIIVMVILGFLTVLPFTFGLPLKI